MTAFEPLTDFGKVPNGWVWGTATAAHQIEGGNVNNDWWRFEHTEGSGTTESSGDACDSWHRWEEDLELVKRMGLDSYRMSIEWSRIEPAEGEFSLAALGQYRRQLAAAQAMGLKTNVTLHHFTTPLWMADKGGWDTPEVVDYFERYAGKVVEYLGEHIDICATFNEPNVVAMMGWLIGQFPPGIQGDNDAHARVTHHFIAAHKLARVVLKAGPGSFPVGLTLGLADIVFHLDGDINGEGVRAADLPGDDRDSEAMRLMSGAYLEAARDDDYIGVQTYFTMHLDANGQPLPVPEEWRTTQMGWTFTPEALGVTVRLAYEVAGVPVIVTENGIATENDDERIEYYSRSLTALRAAMDDGVDVRGFYAWSLLDNFEWAEGYRPVFGLTAVDLETFERTPKPSSQWYAALVAASRS
ncbi:MAG: beta-glucosidase [Actinobacteria bacterium HGW-Actinobacteria-4]|nr:MAG: beta-glucosidase [Actinobacteria bacterium HGW-Actinobacteria-4]